MQEKYNLMIKKSISYAQMACMCDTKQAKDLIKKSKKIRDEAESLKKLALK